ncbi:uncharacterized protein MONOS_17124 [Monocercomonoides exilis]|uniref:uncharacterized protein n=1 Tax=Monocercomonoides exilis TaxID=2049356 RepID=UPI00355A6F97|nr:hypothetical protein MONOS_17124 [Monocercomonoides exilis]
MNRMQKEAKMLMALPKVQQETTSEKKEVFKKMAEKQKKNKAVWKVMIHKGKKLFLLSFAQMWLFGKIKRTEFNKNDAFVLLVLRHGA